eukprot:8560760-Heterocapsa_arctica.AAC.1
MQGIGLHHSPSPPVTAFTLQFKLELCTVFSSLPAGLSPRVARVNSERPANINVRGPPGGKLVHLMS